MVIKYQNKKAYLRPRWAFVLSVVCMIAAVGLVACGGGSETAPANNTPSYIAIPANGIFSDSADGTTIDFIDIVGAALTIDATDIKFEITLRNLPPSLTFNQANVPLNALEYQWAVEFDINNDDVTDYSMSVSHFKSSINQIDGSVLVVSQKDVWKHDAAAGVASHLVTPQATLAGNTMLLSVAKSAHPDLVNITTLGSRMLRDPSDAQAEEIDCGCLDILTFTGACNDY